MKLLVLGGTVFLGRHIVEADIAGSHEVTLFNRGRHEPQLFPDVEKLRGDRDGDLSALHGRRWDAVIDPSGYRPAQIRAAIEMLDGAVAHYTFISSISVFRECAPGRRFDESAPRSDGDVGYGALKSRCEDTLATLLPGRAACVRPGLIVGPHDPTDRFTYWPRRVARGGDVLAPGRPERPVQFIDVRDLAEWCVRLAGGQRTGTFNAVGPASMLAMGSLLETCRAVSASDARFRWVPDETLVAAGVEPWSELPLWIPESDTTHGGLLLADNRRAVTAGLAFRPAADTVRATLDWDRHEGDPPRDSPNRVTPITPEREAALLAQHAALE